jgi:hypothetical protein
MKRFAPVLLFLLPGCVPVEQTGPRSEIDSYSSGRTRPVSDRASGSARRFLVSVGTVTVGENMVPLRHGRMKRGAGSKDDKNAYTVIRIPLRDAPAGKITRRELLLWPDRTGMIALPDGQMLGIRVGAVAGKQGWSVQIDSPARSRGARHAAVTESQLLWIGPQSTGADAEAPLWAVTIRVERLR